MQPKPALLLVACGAVVGALALAPIPATALPAAAGTECEAAPGLTINSWIGNQGPGETARWENDENWSLGHHPGSDSTNEVVCIRTPATVQMDKATGLSVHIAAIDLAGTADGSPTLEVQASNHLFVDEAHGQVFSRVSTGSTLKVNGGVVGGFGRLVIEGKLKLSAQKGSRALVTTRPCGRHCKTPLRSGRWGTISVEGEGMLLVRSRVRVTDSYHVVVVGGELRMRGAQGRVTADRGTRLALRPESDSAKPPLLTFRNDGGWYADHPNSDRVTRVLIHGGVVSKRSGGISSVQGKVSTSDDLNAIIS
jgi:hypothetical protein